MATTTYEPIATYTAPSAQSSYTFSSIPQTYTDLVLVFSGTSVGSFADFGLQLNGDTSSNYSDTIVYGYSGTAGSGRHSNGSFFRGWYISSTQTVNIINIMNYSNTTTYKTVLGRGNTIGGSELDATVGLYRSTSAITSVSITPQGTDIAAGSTLTLYGIASAPAWAAKATGGTITNDVGYTYHTFTSSGTFTPLQDLTCDYLIVAGGGGGGNGGGGAGGYREFTAQSFTSGVGYAATVGAGGAAQAKGGNSAFSTNSSTGGGQSNASTGYGITGGSGGGDSGLTGGAGNEGGYTPVEGYAGASTGGSSTSMGGGGGAGAVGIAGSGSTGGAGGAGRYSTISGTSVARGGGGGGAGASASGDGGVGGGGNGERGGSGGASGAVNTGGGGGGGYYISSGAGGSGIVIVRYAN
jgi:hypothetical protein